MRFPAARRLRSSAEFAQVRAKGVSHPGKYVLLNVLRQPDGGDWRSGIITSRKVGGAVERNRARRRLREIIRETPIQDGVWLVTVARWRIKDAPFAELKQDWLRAARRARILRHEETSRTIAPVTETAP